MMLTTTFLTLLSTVLVHTNPVNGAPIVEARADVTITPLALDRGSYDSQATINNRNVYRKTNATLGLQGTRNIIEKATSQEVLWAVYSESCFRRAAQNSRTSYAEYDNVAGVCTIWDWTARNQQFAKSFPAAGIDFAFFPDGTPPDKKDYTASQLAFKSQWGLDASAEVMAQDGRQYVLHSSSTYPKVLKMNDDETMARSFVSGYQTNMAQCYASLLRAQSKPGKWKNAIEKYRLTITYIEFDNNLPSTDYKRCVGVYRKWRSNQLDKVQDTMFANPNQPKQSALFLDNPDLRSCKYKGTGGPFGKLLDYCIKDVIDDLGDLEA